MRIEQDPVDRALKSLGGQNWPGPNHDIELEDKLMREFDTNRSVTRLGRHPLLIGVLAFVVLGSVGFAAAGGLDVIRSWFVTIEVDGEVIDTLEVLPDEQGNAEFDIPPISTDGESDVTVSIDSGEAGDGEGTPKTINVTLDESGGHIIVEREDPEDDDE